MMYKILYISLILFTSLQADYLYGKNDKCVDDFYFQSGTFYYHYSKDDNDTWHYTTSNNYFKYLYPGFIYDKDNDICKLPLMSMQIGMNGEDFMLVNSLLGATLAVFLIFIFFFYIRI